MSSTLALAATRRRGFRDNPSVAGELWSDDERQVVEQELRLLQPAVRRARAELLVLLHDDFIEFGASGRTFNREAIAGTLIGEEGDETIDAADLRPLRLGEDVILLTYRIEHPVSPSLRSSVWVRTHGSWVLRFHQGTRSD